VTAATGPAAWLATATAGIDADGVGRIELTTAGTLGLAAVAAVGVAIEAVFQGALGYRAATPRRVGRCDVSAGLIGVVGAAIWFIAPGCGAVVAAGGCAGAGVSAA